MQQVNERLGRAEIEESWIDLRATLIGEDIVAAIPPAVHAV